MAQLTGTVTKDARIITTDSGKFAAFDFVENDSYKDKQGNKIKKSYYFNCTLWNAEKIAPFIKKGTIMQLDGNVSVRTYTGGGKLPPLQGRQLSHFLEQYIILYHALPFPKLLNFFP